jgi:hypothetical protein
MSRAHFIQVLGDTRRPSRILSVFMTGVWFLVGMVVPLGIIATTVAILGGFHAR